MSFTTTAPARLFCLIARLTSILILLIVVCSVSALATPHFLAAPFKDTGIKIQQGWVYTFGNQTECGHQGIDYIKGTVDNSSTWETFEVYPAADGVATLHNSTTYGDYVTVKHNVEGVTYYTLYAHLDTGKRKLALETPVTVTRNSVIGMAGKTGSASGGVLHLHFELSKKDYARAECSGNDRVNNCGTCRLDPYGIYGKRSAYPSSQTSACSSTEHYWINCPPTPEAAECANGSSEAFQPKGRPPVHPNGTVFKVGGQSAVYVLSDGVARFISSRELLITLYGFGKGFDFRDVVTISAEEFARYTVGPSVPSSGLTPNGRNEPDGRLITPRAGPRRGEISIVTNGGRRRPFSSFNAFEGLGYRMCNVATVDDYDSYPFDYVHGLPVEAMPVVSGPLTITPNGPYVAGQTLTARFQLRNVGPSAVWLDTVTAGGRFNGDNAGAGGFPDFTLRRSITVPDGQTVDYEGTLVPQRAGNYSFFVAFKDTDGFWTTAPARDADVSFNKSISVGGTIVGAGSTDFFGPKLILLSHIDGQRVIDSEVLVRGSVTDADAGNSGVASVTVNGQRADNDTTSGSGKTEWTKSITLARGLNTITLVATDGSINQTSTTQTFTLDSQPIPRHTISGRILDKTGVPVSGVDVVFGAARFRPNDVFTGADGRFVIDSAYEGFTWNLTPIKQGFYFTPRSRSFESISTDQTTNFTAAPVPSVAPELMVEEGTTHAITLSSQHLLRDPLPPTIAHNFGDDLRTRVMVFARNIALPDGDSIEPRDVGIDAETNRDGQVTGYLTTVEYVGKVPGFDWLTCIVFRLPDSADLHGDVQIKVNFLGVRSNAAFVTIRRP